MKEVIAYWEKELGIFDLGYRQSYAVKLVCFVLIIIMYAYRFAITVLLPIWILPYMIYKAMRWGGGRMKIIGGRMNGKVIIKRSVKGMKIRYKVAEKFSDIGKVTVKKIVGGSAEITVCTTRGKLAEIFSSYESLKKFIGELEALVDESIKFHKYAWPTDEWKEIKK